MEELLDNNTVYEQQRLDIDLGPDVTPDHDIVSEITESTKTEPQRPIASRFVIGAGIISSPTIK